jgi:CBS domain containing-hemolysin-like protein
MSDVLMLLVTVLLLAGNGFFVGAEFAMLTARRERMEALAAAGGGNARPARTVLRAGHELPLLIAGAQLGITVCGLGLGALAEPAIAHLLEAPLRPFGVPAPLLHAVSFTVALAIVAGLHTVLGEMVPKNLAIAGPEKTALWLVPAHYAFCRLTRPVLRLFTATAHGVLRGVKVEPKDELDAAFTPDELADLIGESRREGLLDAAEHRRLTKTLSSAQRTVADVLLPVDRLTTLSEHPTVAEVAGAVAATGFSRFPLRTADGRLTGYLHVKDILDRDGFGSAGQDSPIPRARVRGLPELPADARLDEALAALRRARSHLARAVGQDGTTLGVVTLEDLVEEYVGTVRDATHVGRR